MRKKLARIVFMAAIAIVAVAAGLGVRQYLKGDQNQGLSELHQLVLPDLEGRPQPLAQWQGKILVINFWATWCEPCRDEVPVLVRTQEKRWADGVQIVGIGIDSPGKIREFARTYRINYPLAVAGLDAVDITRKLGNRAGGLPYTVVLDRSGRLVGSHLGGLSEQRLNEMLRPLLTS
jgi:thiol-disulfide isomerase/thioredoxin